MHFHFPVFRNFHFCILLLIAGVFRFFPLNAQFHQFSNYNVPDGLPSSDVYTMMQDASGYLWFGTDMGVSRFDGYQFRNFSTENGLPDNTIFKVYQDKRGRTWFLSFSGKLSYYLDGQVYTLPCNTLLGQMTQGTFMTSLYIDAGDTIWAGTMASFAIKISPGWTNQQVKQVSFPEFEGYLCQVGKDGYIYGGGFSARNKFSIYEGITKKTCTLLLNSILPGIRGNRFSVLRKADGNFLVTANNTILNCNSHGILSQATMNSVGICTFEDSDGTIMAGTYDGVMSWSGSSFSDPQRMDHFKTKVVTAIFRDRENGLWFCTEGSGVSCITHRNFKYYTPGDGLSESKISCVTACAGKVVAGHLDGSFSIMDGASVQTLLPDGKAALSGGPNRISTILSLGDRNILAASGNSIYTLDVFKPAAKEIKPAGCKKIIASADGNIWALRFLYFAKYDRQLTHEQKKIPFTLFADNMYEDHSGKLWICAINGIWTYDDSAGVRYAGGENPLLASRIVDLQESADGSMWMVSRGNGVIVKKGNQYYHITKENGLAGNMCRSIFLDSGNIAWIGTNNGLSRIVFSMENGFHYSVSTFTSKNGLLTNEVNSVIRLGKTIWAIHTNGISVFEPGGLQNNQNPPPVYITNMIVSGDTVHEDGARFRYDQNYLNISFIGLSFKDPGHIMYRYKMENVDSDWVNTAYTSVQYQTLPPGNYRFLVTAQNNDGYWSRSPASVSFTILPAWWQTWLFKTVAGIFILTLLFLLFRIRLNNIRRREQKKNLLQNRIATFELNALRAQMNPHFVFNAINSVQYFITNNDPDSSQKYLSKFAKLIRYVVDNSRLASIPVKQEIDALTLYLDLESLRFTTRFDYSIHVDPNVDTEYLQIPSMLIQPYVENAIWHGLMHKNGKGKIEIRLKMDGDSLYCAIEDNGIGREKSLALKQAKKENTHRSVGLSNTKDRLDIINQVNNSSLAVVITDLHDRFGEACGTLVEIHIPVTAA